MNRSIKKKRPFNKKPTWRNPDDEIREPEFQHNKYYLDEEEQDRGLEKEGFQPVFNISEPMPVPIW